jgi:hypothetical protein
MRHHYVARWVLVSGMTSALTMLSPFQQFVHAKTPPSPRATAESSVSYACVSTYTIRFVPASEVCKTGERRMMISGLSGSTGPQGPEGPAGPAGAQGPAGPAGSAGPTGQTGPKGDVGPKGDTGSKGDTGDKGATGDTGAQGSAGTAGQMVTTAVSTGARFLGFGNGGPYEVPGLSATIATTANSSVVLSTEGVIEYTDDGLVGDNIRVCIRLKIDDVVIAVRNYNVERGNFTKTTHWSFTSSSELLATPLTPGPHTVSVDAMWLGFNRMAPGNPIPSAFVAGTADSWNQSTLTAIVVNK